MVKKLGLILLGSVMLFSEVVKANSRDVDLVRETQQFAQGKNVAVVVGVENYDKGSSGFRPLKYSMDDAVKLTSTLQKKGYYVKRLLNQQAQKSFILNEIRNIAKTVPQGNGTLIFSFSGHGALINQENYLAVPGSVADNLAGTGLSVSDVVRVIKQSGIKRAVLFLDACRNDPTPGIRAAGESGFFDRDYGEGIQVLYATKKGEYSWEHDRLQQGVFNHFLNRGFAGEAAYQGGVVTFSGLASFVERNVPLWTNDRQNQIFQTQLPFRDAKSEYRGDFVLAEGNGSAQVARQPPVQAPQPRPQQPQRQPAPVVTRPQPQPPTARKSFEPDMVTIPAGSFMMGCVPGRDDVDYKCENDEKPAHQVELSAFKIARHEVSFNEWDACERAKACSHAKDEGWGRGNLPVINVSWNDTQKYLQWLSRSTGKRYRLPTEAEWEYAARGGRNSEYPSGEEISCGNANYGGFGGYCTTDRTKPVVSYAPNGFGLKNMSGNVWEWVGDWYDSYTSSSVSNPKGAGSGSERVLRGGSWGSYPKNLGSSIRYDKVPDYRDSIIGFRPAQDLR